MLAKNLDRIYRNYCSRGNIFKINVQILHQIFKHLPLEYTCHETEETS